MNKSRQHLGKGANFTVTIKATDPSGLSPTRLT